MFCSPQLAARSSQLAARIASCTLSALIATLVSSAGSVSGQVAPPQAKYSTHDFTRPFLGLDSRQYDFYEWWADVKMPGDGRNATTPREGRAYAVGTIELKVAGSRFSGWPLPQFSDALAPVILPPAPPPFLEGFLAPGSVKRQVAIIQVSTRNEIDNQSIVSQAYYFGGSAASQNEYRDSTTATNARAISVWPGEAQGDTRIVICGESEDAWLPLSQANPPASGRFSGFIAVYGLQPNNQLQLLWTYRLFGGSFDYDTAVTDVSVRVEERGGQLFDVVTYCGVSAMGTPQGPGLAPLTPLRAFPAPAGGPPCSNPASGSVDNGPGEWDGFVGRISNVHTAPTPGGITKEFHSVVGGPYQDGLFGLAELSANRFVVVGSTAAGRGGLPLPAPGAVTFPFTTTTCLNQPDASTRGYCLGTMLVFDASNIDLTQNPGPSLALIESRDLGGVDIIVGENTVDVATVARDVIVQGPHRFGGAAFDEAIYVVGSTTDPNLFARDTVGTSAPLTAYGGAADGFLIGFVGNYSSAPPVAAAWKYGTFSGDPAYDGWTGIGAWNEFDDSVVVTGFQDLTGALDIVVRSYSITSNYSVPQSLMVGLTAAQIGGSSIDYPTAMGGLNATNFPASALRFLAFDMGDPAGGGIAQGSNGRVNVVGTTASLDFPTIGGRGKVGAFNDAVRVAFDLLPANVGRTDGTGATPPNPLSQYPLAGTNGGTTPPCALDQLGARIGEPSPSMQHLLIDYEGGVPAPGAQAALLVTRTPTTAVAGAGIVVAAVQFGFPGVQAPMQVFSGVEIWMTDASHSEYFWSPQPDAVFRAEFTLPPLSSATFSAQVGFGLMTLIPDGNPELGFPCAGAAVNSSFVATPALWINW